MTSDAPSVSVVIAAYNHAEYLAESVHSALEQTLGRPQIIVVDDGSTDDTADVAAGLEVELIRRANGGPSAARNTGMLRATGHFVVFLDADDRLHPNHNAACVAALAAHPEATYAYTQWQRFGVSDEVSDFPEFSAAELPYRNFVHSAALVPTSVARSVRYDERLRWGMEDWDFYLSLLEHGFVGVLVDEPLLLYRQRASGRSVALSSKAMKGDAVMLYLTIKHRRLFGARGFLRRLRSVLGWTIKDARGAVRRRISLRR